ncbi:MAG: hypothetical protein J1G07_04960 [Clostridiales bacterium]|nr:hypothetical protein [Clostridiales bacterium]
MECYEIIFHVIDSLIAVIALILVIFGWIIPAKKNESLEQLKWEKDYIDLQISELYGPLSACLHNGQVIRCKVFKQLGRHYVFAEGESISDLPVHEQIIWKHYVKNYKLKYLRDAVLIVQQNYHLIDEKDDYNLYEAFIKYTLIWDFTDNQYNNGIRNNYNFQYETNYPYEFEEQINATLEFLKEKKRLLIKKLDSKNV